MNFEGLTIRGAARQFKVHRRKVRNSLASAIPSERKVAPKRRPKLGQYEATVRRWLAEDVDLQRKQRHAATRIWERLIDESKADVSPLAVRVSVKERKAEINPLVSTTMIPQIRSPGESANVDYGDVYVELVKNWSKPRCLRSVCQVLTWPSTGSMPPKPRSASLMGTERPLRHLGGVFLTQFVTTIFPLVQKVLIGRKRVENERFVAFRSHWEFISSFSTSGVEGAHKKDETKRATKRAKLSYFAPELNGAATAEISDKLDAKVAQHDLRRHIEFRRNTSQEDFEKKNANLMPLAEFD